MGNPVIKKMDPTVKLRWVRALRSGEYKQSKESFLRISLKDGSKMYCCLGVLCELYAREYTRHQFETPTNGEIGDRMMGIPNVLPVPVMKWARLNSETGPVLGYQGDQVITLASLHDQGYDFQVIADIIEQQL